MDVARNDVGQSQHALLRGGEGVAGLPAGQRNELGGCEPYAQRQGAMLVGLAGDAVEVRDAHDHELA